MSRQIQLKTRILPFIILLGFVLLGLSPKALAVVPPPDGGYPNFNTAEGTNALKNLTSGAANTGVGWSSLLSVTTGSFNTATGAGTLLFNTANENTATGAAALLSNTIGDLNTANGSFALFKNTEGGGNTATGWEALYSNETGYSNAAFGAGALLSNTTGFENTAIGNFALAMNTEGLRNTAVGGQALSNNTEGIHNNALGLGALGLNETGNSNNAFGAQALVLNITGARNSAFGDSALFSSTGSGNTAMGNFAGYDLTTGDRNICIGDGVRGVAAESNRIRIGDNLPTGSGQSACYIGGIVGQSIDPGTAVNVGIDASGKLGTTASSRRFKRDIKPMNTASQAIHSLNPVAFHYKSDAKNTPCFGLIAEEVAAVNPDLVVRGEHGEIYSVRYDAINAMLLNEFLKEHQKVQEQAAAIAQLKRGMESLIALIKEQDSKIQKVSDRLEMRNDVLQVAVTSDVAEGD